MLQIGLNYNIVLNTYLSFEQKFEILSLLNKVTHGISYELIDEYYYIYPFYEYIHNFDKNKTQLNNKNKYFAKVINDFHFAENLYDYIIYLCEVYDKNALNKYIESLNNFIIKGHPILTNFYRIKYNLSINNIKDILNIIFIFKKQNYSGIYENNQSINSSKIEEEAKVKFYLSDKKLSEYILLDIFQRKKNDINALKIIFSFKYDFCDYIDSFQIQINNLISEYNYNFQLSTYLLTLDTLENNLNKEYENKIIIRLTNLLFKNHIFLYKDPKLKIKQNNYFKLNFLFDHTTKSYKSNINYFSSVCMKYLLKNWDKPLDILKISNFLEKNITSCCLFLINSIRNREERIKVINFFFKDFLFLLNPELKKKYEFLKNICFDYINCFEENESEIIENQNNEKEEKENESINNFKDSNDSNDSYERKKKTKNILKEFNQKYDLDEYGNYKRIDYYYNRSHDKERKYYYNLIKLKNALLIRKKYRNVRKIKEKGIQDTKGKKNFCFIMMLINIKIKYGNYNPNILFNICKKCNMFMYSFFNYIDISHENIKKKDIISQFFLTKEKTEDLELNLKNCIFSNFSYFKTINHSFLTNFYTDNKIKNQFDELDFYEYYSLFYMIKLRNIPEKSNIFINIIIDKIIKKKFFFS